MNKESGESRQRLLEEEQQENKGLEIGNRSPTRDWLRKNVLNALIILLLMHLSLFVTFDVAFRYSELHRVENKQIRVYLTMPTMPEAH